MNSCYLMDNQNLLRFCIQYKPQQAQVQDNTGVCSQQNPTENPILHLSLLETF